MNKLLITAKLLKEMSRHQNYLTSTAESLLGAKNLNQYDAEYAVNEYSEKAGSTIKNTALSLKTLSAEYKINLDKHLKYLTDVYETDLKLIEKTYERKAERKEVFDFTVGKFYNLINEYNVVTKVISDEVLARKSRELKSGN